MTIEVLVDLEQIDGGQKVVWWATAPSIGNLAVAADSLQELEVLAREAIDLMFDERGEAPGEVRFTLRNDAPISAGAERPAVEFLPTPSGDGSPPVAAPTTSDTALAGQRAARELVPA
jgi:hypothetical protein